MKSKTKQTTQNTYGYQTPPTTQAQQDYDQYIKTAFDTPDPTIPYTFGNIRQNLNNRFDNPFGFNYSPEVQDAIKYAGNNEIDQRQGQAVREDRFNRVGAKASALGASASMHAPQLVQTGGSMQGTTTSPLGPALIGAVGSIGGGALA